MLKFTNYSEDVKPRNIPNITVIIYHKAETIRNENTFTCITNTQIQYNVKIFNTPLSIQVKRTKINEDLQDMYNIINMADMCIEVYTPIWYAFFSINIE